MPRILRSLSIPLLMGMFLHSSSAASRPNIIVIYTDDQGFGDVSALNPEAKFQTPNLDRLVNEGIAFTNGHSPDTVCTPSRYGLLTGRYCWRTTKKTGVMGAEGQCLIADGRTTIASLLRDQGYATAMVGKWHLGMDFPGENPATRDWSKPVLDMPLDKGFDTFFGIPASLNYGVLAWFRGRHAEVPPTVFTAKKPNDRHVDYRIMPPYQDSPEETKKVVGAKGREVAADFIDNQCLTRFTDEAISYMGSVAEAAKDGTPFFLYLPYTSPHYPVCPLPEFWGQGDCGGYGEFMIETDHHVGRILDYLAEAGLDENTLIVYTSDNGPEKSWAGRIKEFDHDSSGIYAEGKRSIYEGGHRVPFLLRWPGGIAEPGRQIDSLVGQTDLLATFAEMVGAALPDDAGEDSVSFATLLSNASATHQRPALINHGSDGRFAVTEGSWKLIFAHGKATRELYDLEADPAEKDNLIDAHPEKATALEALATSIVLSGRTTPGVDQPNDTGYWKDLTWIEKSDYPADDVQP